jgi:hypothetical protein
LEPDDKLMNMTGSSTLTGGREGVFYATTRQGHSLPVIDVSNPCFTVPDDAGSLTTLREELAESERRRKRVPRFLLKWMMRSMGRRSLLARELLGGDAEVLSGLTTYVMKLGAGNLVAPFNTSIDQRLAAAPGVMSMRVRLQQLAKLLAEELRGELVARSGAPLHLLTIGGGTAIDSLNTLILLRRSASAALEGREITLHVLDPDSEGPEFGARALAALSGDSGPLNGLNIRFSHVPYNWKDASTLADFVRELSSSDTLIAASTEGALFEYGDDATVVSNLQALRSGRNVALVGGTVTRPDPLTREFITTSRFKLVPRSAEEFAALVEPTGFKMTRMCTALLSNQVLLRPV